MVIPPGESEEELVAVERRGIQCVGCLEEVPAVFGAPGPALFFHSHRPPPLVGNTFPEPSAQCFLQETALILAAESNILSPEPL